MGKLENITEISVVFFPGEKGKPIPTIIFDGKMRKVRVWLYNQRLNIFMKIKKNVSSFVKNVRWKTTKRKQIKRFFSEPD